jgi:hypothetical protein
MMNMIAMRLEKLRQVDFEAILYLLGDLIGRSVECPRQYSAQRQAYYKSSALGRFSPYVAAVIEHSLAGER